MKTQCLFLVVSCAAWFSGYTKAARILGMFPANGKSHFVMFEGVMKGLADAGHQVDVVSHFPLKKPYPNYRDIINLEGTIPSITNNITYEFMKTFSKISSIDKMINMLGTTVCNLMELPELQKLIENPPNDPPYDLVIAEFFFASCYFAFGRHLNVPVVALGSSSAILHTNAPLGNPSNPAIVPVFEASLTDGMNFWQRLANTVTNLLWTEVIRHYMAVQNEIVKKHFGPEMSDIEELERDLSLYLVNSHPVFNGIRPMTPAVVEVAGLHVLDNDMPMSTELKKWLDESENGFIYFSLGSMVRIETFPKSALAEIYSAFNEIAPIRVVMKVANPKELPPGLPDNVLLLSWAPQVQILKHKNIRGFMTHGGLMGVQEAVTFGVPLIGIPLFGDQMGNIEVCVEKETAVALDYNDLKADKIVPAIKAITNDPKYKINMKAISKLFLDRPRTARDTAVFWIEYILNHGGDALRSPAVKLTWWQLALLDVYGTILAAVLIILYVVKLLLSTIIGRVLRMKRAALPSKKRN